MRLATQAVAATFNPLTHALERPDGSEDLPLFMAPVAKPTASSNLMSLTPWFVFHGGIAVGKFGGAYMVAIWSAMTLVASSSEVMTLPLTLKTGAACGLSMRNSCAILAQLVCPAKASLMAALFLSFYGFPRS